MNYRNVIVGILVIIISIFSYYTFTDFSDGERSGTIVKFSYKQVVPLVPFCSAWEGEMVLGGLKGDSSNTGGMNLFQFTVTDKEIVKQIQEKLRNGDRTVIFYGQPHWNFPCSTISGSFVRKVVR